MQQRAKTLRFDFERALQERNKSKSRTGVVSTSFKVSSVMAANGAGNDRLARRIQATDSAPVGEATGPYLAQANDDN